MSCLLPVLLVVVGQKWERSPSEVQSARLQASEFSAVMTCYYYASSGIIFP